MFNKKVDRVFYVLIFLCSFFVSNAQLTRYIIQFKDKATNPYSISNPSSYLSTKAIARRTNFSIAIDSFDLPITPRYIDSVRLAGAVTILNKSKWLNSITIKTTDAAALTKINSLPFVVSVKAFASRLGNIENLVKPKDKFEIEKLPAVNPINTQRNTATNDYYNYGNTYNEISLHNGQFLHNIGLRGQGVLVAVIDAGFYQYTTLKAFDSVNANNQILQTWDFVNNETSVAEDDTHGMSCFSTIAGNVPGTFVGNAPKANFVLYRTEDASTEYPIEEFNWVCGLERADSCGADIVSTSLGYTTFDNATLDYAYSNMDGKTTISAKGGKYAHRKGMLLFSAMGNDGNNSWKYLSTSADLDSIVSVGAVNTAGVVGSFSSYGPSFDGRIKPEASAVGASAYVQQPNNTFAAGNGTSYACPKMAGLGTLLRQGFPEQTNYAIRTAIIKSGSIYSSPNDRIGYGVPDMKKAFCLLLNNYAKITASAILNCKTSLSWKSKDVSTMKYEIERMTSAQTTYTKIGEVQGSESILANHTYTYSDSLINVQSGIIKYRIKQIVDTTLAGYYFTYIDSASINLASSCVATPVDVVTVANEQFYLAPNPAKNKSVLKVITNYAITNLNIRIYDINGRLVRSLKTQKGLGTKEIELPINTMVNGTYVVNIYNGNSKLKSLQLVKM